MAKRKNNFGSSNKAHVKAAASVSKAARFHFFRAEDALARKDCTGAFYHFISGAKYLAKVDEEKKHIKRKRPAHLQGRHGNGLPLVGRYAKLSGRFRAMCLKRRP